MSLLAIRLLRLCQGLATFVSVLSLNVFIVVLILKLDTTGLLATTSWMTVCSPLLVSIVAALLAAGLNRFELDSDEIKPLLTRINHSDFMSLAFLADRMTPSSIGRFYEADIFMRLLIGFCLLFLTVIGVLVQYNECRCQTPIKILIQTLAASYALRSLLQCTNVRFVYARFGQIMAAITSYHDVPNAKRLSDLAKWHAAAWTGFQKLTSMLRSSLSAASVSIAILATYRVQTDTCMSDCPDLFTQSQHYLFAVYVCEVFDITRKLIFNWYSGSINLKQLVERIRSQSAFYNTTDKPN